MKNKFGRFLLSVLIAFGLWWYVISAVSPGFSDTVYNIPVVLEGENLLNERGLMITGVSHSRVSLRLSGNRSNVVKINAENTTARVDVSKISETGSQIPVSYSPSFSGEAAAGNGVIAVEAMSPTEITLSVSRLVTRELPVEVRWIGTAGDGFITDRESRTLDSASVTLSGPEEVMSHVAKACIDVPLEGRTESISETFPLILCDADGNPVDAKLVTTNTDSIRLEVKIEQVRDVNLTYHLVEGGGAKSSDVVVTLSQQTLRVAGSESALDAMGESFVVGTINLAEITHSGSVSLPINLPAGVRNLTGETEVTAEIIISGLSMKDLTVNKIRTTGVPEGTRAEIVTKSMEVTVRGPSAAVGRVESSDVTLVVDLTGAEPGTSTYKAVFEFADGFESLGVVHSEPVTVTLKSK